MDSTLDPAAFRRGKSRPLGPAAAAAAVALGALLTLAAPTSWAQDKVVRFGASLPLTGRLAPEGRLVKDGYDFAVRHINEQGGIPIDGASHRIEIVYYDDESDPKTAVKLIEKLIVEDDVDFLLGPYSSSATFPASSISEKYQIPMVEAHGAATAIFEQGFKYIFATLNTVDQYLPNVVKMAAELENPPQSVAIVYENALAMQLGAEAAAKEAEAHGMDVVYMVDYPTGTTDMSSMLAEAKSKSIDFFMGAAYTTDAILMTRQAHEMGLAPKMVGMILGPTLPAFEEALGQDINYLLEPVQWTKTMTWKDEALGITATEFAEMFEREFGYEPDYHPPQSAAAVLVYYHALKKAGTLDPQKVRDALAGTDIMTFYGPVRFNEKGQNVGKPMAVVQIQDMQPVVVYPKEFATGELIYPIPRD
jgi:branched-chain amino acid transport system substrate-binding protein